jgi:mannose-1-phosphate guanylyltransferase
MSTPLIPVILAGGKGERFWPLSRLQRPKQFLSLDGSGRSLLQATADRLLPMAGGWDQLWVITASHLEQGVKEQLPELPAANLLVEPEGRDTAPAVAWTTIELKRRYGTDAIAGFFPADHYIAAEDAYRETLRAAAQLAAEQNGIVTLGIQPTYPSTGYGYIEQGQAVQKYGDHAAFTVNRFTEKPDLATAESFIASGSYSWNSGMFIFKTGVMLQELASHASDLVTALEQQGAAAYSQLTKLSIDYAVMEKTQKAYVIPAAFGWDDLGDWNALERLLKDGKTNVELGRHVGLDTQDSIFYAADEAEVIVTIGLDDVVVVRDGKATLIVRKDRTQDIKKALKLLKDDPDLQNLL